MVSNSSRKRAFASSSTFFNGTINFSIFSEILSSKAFPTTLISWGLMAVLRLSSWPFPLSRMMPNIIFLMNLMDRKDRISANYFCLRVLAISMSIDKKSKYFLTPKQRKLYDLFLVNWLNYSTGISSATLTKNYF